MTSNPANQVRGRLRFKVALRELITLSMLAAAYLLAFALRFEFRVPTEYQAVALGTLPIVMVGKQLLLWALRTRRHSWQFTSLRDIVGIVAAMFAASVALLGLRYIILQVPFLFRLTQGTTVPLGVVVADLALSILALTSVRAIRRLHVEEREIRRLRGAPGPKHPRRVLVIGAGREGRMVAREIQTRPDLGLKVIGFCDDDASTHRQRIQGVDVHGDTAAIPRVVADERVDQAIIAIAGIDGPSVRRLVEICQVAGIETQIIPGVYEILDGRVNLSRLRPVRIEDLLRRKPVELDTSSIAHLVAGATVMVTGAGGSIGSELCRQLIRYQPKELVLVEQAEPALWKIDRELAALASGTRLVPAIADVCDDNRVMQLLATHAPGLVFHAAAHKHVPLMENNPAEAVKNNLFGTQVLADAALAAGVRRFVLVSTDKAVNPSSVMGATKRLAERYVQHLALDTDANFVSVRFGNVLGSTGSVIPVFEQQIADGGPVKVTHPEMRRYFMTIAEASALVVQAAAVGRSGEILVLDMGEPILISDLARDLVRLSGLRPDVDIAIEYSGIRPGEKLFEELSLHTETTDRTVHPSIFVSRSSDPSWTDARTALEALRRDVEAGDEPAIRARLRRLVPEMAPAAPESAT